MNDSKTTVRQLLDQIEPQYTACREQIVKLGGAGARGEPMVELYHAIKDSSNLDTWRSTYQERGDNAVLGQMMMFVNHQAEPIIDRLRARESKMSLSGFGWKGEPPSEVMQSIFDAIVKFRDENPTLATQAGRRGSPPSEGRAT